MDRSDRGRAVELAVVLLGTLLPLGLIGALWALPPVRVDQTDVAWLPPALAASLVAIAAVAALASLAIGLRRGEPAFVLSAGASAALAGGAITLVSGAASMALPLLAAALLLAASRVAADTWRAMRRRAGIVLALGTLLVVEMAALLEILPPTAGLTAAFREPLLIAAVLVAAAIAVASRGLGTWVGALLALGGVGLLAARGGSFESVIGLSALIGSQAIALRERLQPAAAEPVSTEAELADLAARLSDAVLRFDGHLRLRDWNGAAATLLGLDASSAGTRLEDLLGVSMADLPADEATVVSRRAVGGLEIAMHRGGSGVTAVIRDPGATPESERLGHELRATLEELLRARRTIDLQRTELERSSTVDPLTGVSSRGAILERLRMEVAQARRYRHPLAVVMLDIDHFGELNRAHGIGGGDTVLREVALRFRLRMREADAIGRAGSDCFVAALPHTDEAGAATFADALRHRLGSRPVEIGGEPVSVSASIGVGTMRAGEDLDLDGLLARVEEAVASAREAGGGRIALDRLHGLVRLRDPHPPAGPSEEPGTQHSGR